ncbi:hypothetical protein EYF80_013864 [Liparis tanakae]|uniref:Uncharacterized protein n=1 Tax=Liparis tanakae TaxID=230148 RepID=A0A4Z2IEL9_9TELE|nr:hypothetical protein EYF80_013864 [Liparis tanakae]
MEGRDRVWIRTDGFLDEQVTGVHQTGSRHNKEPTSLPPIMVRATCRRHRNLSASQQREGGREVGRRGVKLRGQFGDVATYKMGE